MNDDSGISGRSDSVEVFDINHESSKDILHGAGISGRLDSMKPSTSAACSVFLEVARPDGMG